MTTISAKIENGICIRSASLWPESNRRQWLMKAKANERRKAAEKRGVIGGNNLGVSSRKWLSSASIVSAKRRKTEMAKWRGEN